MGRVQIRIHHRDAEASPDTELETANVGAALIVSDINLRRGTADLYDGERRLARLVKRGSPHAPFWEVS